MSKNLSEKFMCFIEDWILGYGNKNLPIVRYRYVESDDSAVKLNRAYEILFEHVLTNWDPKGE